MATATKQLTAARAFDRVSRRAEKIRNDAAHDIPTASVGDAWPQGDVLILCIDGVPKGATRIKNPDRQLAPGNTQGSRHLLDGMDGVALYRLKDATPLDGPVIESPDRPITVTHPEHGDVTLPAGTYAICYQRAYAEELRAVAD